MNLICGPTSRSEWKQIFPCRSEFHFIFTKICTPQIEYFENFKVNSFFYAEINSLNQQRVANDNEFVNSIKSLQWTKFYWDHELSCWNSLSMIHGKIMLIQQIYFLSEYRINVRFFFFWRFWIPTFPWLWEKIIDEIKSLEFKVSQHQFRTIIYKV